MERTAVINCDLKDKSYMDETQLNYFKNILIRLKISMVEKIYQNKEQIKTMRPVGADIIDQSNSLVAVEHEIHSQKRHYELLRQIDTALNRIEDGSFGYCKITGSPIGLKRLEVLPFTDLSIEVLQKMETLS